MYLLGLGKVTPFLQKLLQTPTNQLSQLYQNDQPFKHFVLFSFRIHLDRHELRQSQGRPAEERSRAVGSVCVFVSCDFSALCSMVINSYIYRYKTNQVGVSASCLRIGEGAPRP